MSTKIPYENQIVEGDSLHILKQLDDDSIDSIVTDPPYGYSFMGKDWDKAVVSVDTWKECLRVLKAGAFAFIMSSPRQDVLCKMILNLIDAGFETNFTSIYWTYASGFPKAANVSKLVDKRLGAERQVISGTSKPHEYSGKFDQRSSKDRPKDLGSVSEAAKKLDGSYAGFQPKPALETILVVMKPLSEKSFVDQALKNGKGITWLDDCRIPFKDEKDLKSAEYGSRNGIHSIQKTNFENGYRNNIKTVEKAGIFIQDPPNQKGRFPANLIVSDDSLNDGKITKSTGGFSNWTNNKGLHSWNEMKVREGDRKETVLAQSDKIQKLSAPKDEGSYSRYFDLDAWFLAIPKASPSERGTDNKHPTVKPLKLMSYLITMGSRENDIILDPFCGSGTTCIAAHQLHRRYIGIELQKEYVDIANKRLEPYLKQTKLSY